MMLVSSIGYLKNNSNLSVKSGMSLPVTKYRMQESLSSFRQVEHAESCSLLSLKNTLRILSSKLFAKDKELKNNCLSLIS